VLRNFVRMGIRSRATAERSAARLCQEPSAEPPTPETLLSRLDTQRLLARLVGELDEPYRSTVLLRFYEGLSSAEIARAHKIPPGTVRFRLKIALDRLRHALDAKANGDRVRWRLALLPLARPRWRWLGTKGALAMAMKSSTKIGLVVLLLLGVGVGVGRLALHTRAVPAGARSGAPARVAASAPAMAQAPKATPAAAPIRLLAARIERDPSAKSGTFEGQVINWSTGAGVASAELTLLHAGAANTVITDADGQFRFQPPASGRYAVQTVTANGYLPFAPEWDHSLLELDARPGLRIRNLTLYLTPALDYTGHVVDPDGQPVAGAQVRLLDARSGEQALATLPDRFLSDARGEFVFHARDNSILEASDGKHAPGRAALDGPAAVSHQLTIRLGRGDANARAQLAISGRVTDEQGRPLDEVLVVATHDPEAAPAQPHPVAQTTTGPQGEFVLTGVDDGAYTIAASRRGRANATRQGVPAGATGIVLALPGGGIVAGRVLDAKGQPVPAFTLVATRARSALEQVVVASASVIDGNGWFELRDLPPGEVRLLASAAGFASSQPALAQVDAERPVEITLRRGGTLRGMVHDRLSGEALAHARVSVETALGGLTSVVPIQSSTVSDADGGFELSGIAPGPRSPLVAAYGHHMRMLPKMQFEDDQVVGPITVDLAPTKPGETPQLELVGIGVTLKADRDALLVERVFADSGAAEAGISAGDRIVAVDGVPVAQLGFDGSIQSIRGPEGTSAQLTIRRGDAQLELAVVRKPLRV
jgi:protocatechuate 3,4-dioxygenase beta subunit